MTLHNVSNPLCNDRRVGRLIALSAMGFWCEVRTIGFKNKLLRIEVWNDLVESAVLERCYSADSVIKPTVGSYLLCLLEATGETVKDTTQVFIVQVIEQCENFLKSITHMYHNGEVKLFRPLHLDAKRILLFGKKGLVPIEVNTHLPYRDIISVLQLRLDDAQLFLIILPNRTGVQAHHALCFRMVADHFFERTYGRHVNIGQQEHVNIPRFCAENNLSTIFVKLIEVEVRMGVNQHHGVKVPNAGRVKCIFLPLMSRAPRFLIIRFSSIGDIVLTTPVMRTIHEQIDAAAEIHYLTKSRFVPLLEHNPRVTKVYGIEKATAEVTPQLREAEFDYIIDLHRNVRSSMVKRALKMIDFTVDKRNFDKWLLVRFGKDRLRGEHIVQRYLKTLKAFGVEEDDKGLEFDIPESEQMNASAYGLETPYFCIALGAQHEGKTMPSSLIEAVIAEVHVPFALLGGPEDVEKGKALASKFSERVVNFAGQCSIHQSGSLIAQSSGIVSGDSGLMHIGSALGVPVISVWGCTSPAIGMAPYRPHAKSTIVEPEGRDRRPCSKLGDRCKYGKKNRCITVVKPSQIIDPLRRLL